MERPPHAYDDGMEMAHYQGMEVNEYQGMEANQYPGTASDEEKRDINVTTHTYDEDGRGTRLHRDLKTRQISMIALGGALGTGLLINTGPYLANSGPGSMLIGYALVGILCFCVMSAMGEMAAWLPLPSGFTGFAHRFVDPALGFALGWNYWFKYIITTPNNLIAAVLVISYWFKHAGYDGPGDAPAIYVALILIVIIAINYFGVGVFGEFEFWFSSAKVLILLGLIIFTLCVAAGVGNVDHPTGFHYWSDPGAFAVYKDHNHPAAGRFLGFWNVLQSAVFSFLGAELVGITVGEAANPRKAIPRAVKLTFFRIVFFYLVLILLLGMTVPYNDSRLLTANKTSKANVNAEASPFMVAAMIAGYPGIVTALNIFLLIFTFSAANSDLYIATRTLYSLSIEGNAAQIFSRTDARGVPVYALGASSLVCCIAFVAQKVGVYQTFDFFVKLVTVFGILTWISILISHICFVRARRAQGVLDSHLAYVSPFGIIGSSIGLVFACFITFFNGWVSFTAHPFTWRLFLVSYLPIPIYIAMIFGYKFIKRSKTVVPDEADLFGGKKRIDDEEEEWLAEEARRMGGSGNEKGYRRLYRVTLGNFF